MSVLTQSESPRTRLSILGVPIDPVGMAQSVDKVRQFLDTSQFHLVVTLGTEMIMRAQHDGDFRGVVEQASLIVPDGIGPVYAARLHGFPMRERVAGVELIQVLVQQLGPKLRLFLLGGGPGIAEEAASTLSRIGPGIQIAGCRDGFFESDQEIVEQIAASGANVVLVGMGFPRQESWLLKHGPATGAQVGIGVGGSFDVLSGRVKRAPVWMQRCGLEWLHRFVLQPSRWRRMLALPQFGWRVIRGGKTAVRPVEQREGNA